MAITADKIWFDGEMVAFEDAKIHVLAHTLHYGLGAFEGIRCYKRGNDRSAIFRLKDHIRRLFESCHIVTIDIPWTQDEIEQACVDIVTANNFEDCYIRPVVFLGHGEMGLSAMSNKVRVAVAAWEWGAYLGDQGLTDGIRGKVSSFARNHVNAVMAKGKVNGHYVNSILAKREVMKQGYQEAIILDTEGYVSEASGENVFLVRDNTIITAPLGMSILDGITRHTVITLAQERDMQVKELRFTRDMLYVADEVFACGTAAEITPIREVDDRMIGDGKLGPITKALQEAYFDLVRGDSADHAEWLTYVN